MPSKGIDHFFNQNENHGEDELQYITDQTEEMCITMAMIYD